MLTALSCSVSLWAYDFSAVNGDGVTIYYNILSASDKTVEVTYREELSGDEGRHDYEGSVTIPEEVVYNGTAYTATRIGEDAFWFSNDLVSVTIGSTVTSIGYSAFHRCFGLNTLVLGENVETIDEGAFYECYSLSYITSLNPEPPVIYNGQSMSFNRMSCKLYVPRGSMDAYASASIWKTFFNVEEIDVTAISDTKSSSADKEAELVGYYTADGKRIGAQQRGVNILNYSDGSARKVLVR